MEAVKNIIKKFSDESTKIFAIAILISLLWHVLWLLTIKVVAKDDSSSGVKFSKVSFLGPILGKEPTVLKAGAKEKTFLEKRYSKEYALERQDAEIMYNKRAFAAYSSAYSKHLRDERITSEINEALGADKLEPLASSE